MAGSRGPLKLVGPDKPVAQAHAGSAAAVATPLAPNKPKAVAEDTELNQLWDEVVPQLDKSGLLSPADVMSVEMAMRHFLAARQAHEEMQEDGAMINVNDERPELGRKKNPAEQVFRYQSEAFMEYAKQLGMTFAARARTPMARDEEGGGGNPFAEATGS